MSDIIDLRSDTVTRPTPEMRQAMASAPVGDDVYGEDPTVLALEQEFAASVAKPAALFLPTGTMSNQVALRCHTRPGDAVVCVREAHLLLHETGASAALAGVQLVEAGGIPMMSVAEYTAALYPDDIHFSKMSLLWLELPHTQGGGYFPSPEELRELAQAARAKGHALHIDGARLHNAVVAAGVPAAAWTEHCDSVSVCLCKGLGAPTGSMLAGSEAFIAQARRVRKMYGGGMRQVGILAAAGRYALAHHVERLAEDHRRAGILAAGLRAKLGASGIKVECGPTNSVVIECPDAAAFVADAGRRGVLLTELGATRLRAMTHLDIDDAAVAEALERLGDR